MFKEPNPLLHSELRLAVMSILIGVESADFVFIRQQTGATAGNLSVQLDKLAKADYIEIEKTFRGKMPCTVCRITDTGRDAFAEYVVSLGRIFEVAVYACEEQLDRGPDDFEVSHY